MPTENPHNLDGRRALTRDGAYGPVEPTTPNPEGSAHFDVLVEQSKARVESEHAARYADLWACVEIADRHVQQDFEDEVVQVRRADWNRIVAVARGHMSERARKAIERFHEQSFQKAVKP